MSGKPLLLTRKQRIGNTHWHCITEQPLLPTCCQGRVRLGPSRRRRLRIAVAVIAPRQVCQVSLVIPPQQLQGAAAVTKQTPPLSTDILGFRGMTLFKAYR